MTIPSREELFKIGADVALARSAARADGRRLSPEEVYTEGSDANLFIAATSAMAEETIRASCARLKDLLSSTAEGGNLDRVVADRYNGEVPRLEASFSIGSVTFSRDIAISAAELTIESGRKLRAKNGKVFKTVFPVTFPVSGPGPYTVRVQALETGPGGNVIAGEVTALVSPLAGVSVTNASRMAGGDDEEGDDRYRERQSRFFINARRGVIGAIEYGALLVPGVRRSTAIEELDSLGRPTGRVQLFISDAAGASNNALAELVRNELSDYRSAGGFVEVFASAPRFEAIVLNPRFEVGVDTSLAWDRLRRAIVSRLSELAPAEPFLRSILFAVGRSIDGVIVRDDFVAEPVGDVEPSSGESIRTTLALITVSE